MTDTMTRPFERRAFNVCHTETAPNGHQIDQHLDAPEFDTLDEVKAYIDEHRDELPPTARPGWFTENAATRTRVTAPLPEEHGGAPGQC